MTDAFFLRWVDDFFIRIWVSEKIADYYEVESVNFIDKTTGKTYREQYLSGELKVL